MNQTQKVIIVDTFIGNLKVLKDLSDIYRDSDSKDPVTVKMMDEFEEYVAAFGKTDREIFQYLVAADESVFHQLAERIIQIQHKVFTESGPSMN